MYFFDPMDFAFPKGSATSNIQQYVIDGWYSHYYMNNYMFVNNPDGTLGVYYDSNNFTGSTGNTTQNFTSQINEEYCNALSAKFNETRVDLINAFYSGYTMMPDCYRASSSYMCSSERFATFFQSYTYRNIPSCYWDKRRKVCAVSPHPMGYGNEEINTSACCGDGFSVYFNDLTSDSLSSATTNENFDLLLNTQLVDAKNRKTLSAYATLRALYDRYLNSTYYSNNQSSAYDYDKMNNLADKVGNEWVEIVEQVVPSTTIWGSVRVYGNTVFDQQKFKYRNSTLFTCVGGSCKLDNLEFINNCMENIIDKFYTNECP